MENKRKTKSQMKGITLIALVVTIVILLILAGVSINLVLGPNGLISKAQEAALKTEEAEKNEENILNGYEDIINEYVGIDWDTVLANAEMHPDQKNSTAIGVGTDGRPVNMDLWIYSVYDNGYALNSSEVLSGSIQNASYDNYNIETDPTKEGYGKIQGTIPTYISEDNGESWKTVVNLNRTFYHCTNLISMPEIPTTVVELVGTFMGCTSLQNVTTIPNSVTNMQSTFYNCTSLKEIKQLPNNLINMKQTFYGCTSLQDICEIPDSVTNMYATFRDCVSLSEVNITIPADVTNIRHLFNGCTHLYGNINILANLSLEKEEDGFYSYDGWLFNTATETSEILFLGPPENKTLIEQIKPNNDNIKGTWE